MEYESIETIFRRLCKEFITCNAKDCRIEGNSAICRFYGYDTIFRIELSAEYSSPTITFRIQKDDSWVTLVQFSSEYTYREVWISISAILIALENVRIYEVKI